MNSNSENPTEKAATETKSISENGKPEVGEGFIVEQMKKAWDNYNRAYMRIFTIMYRDHPLLRD